MLIADNPAGGIIILYDEASMRQKPIKELTAQKQLGKEIKQRRLELGLSRKDLQEATGLSYPYLSEIETGKKMPSTQVLRRVAEALGTEASELLQAAEQISKARGKTPPPAHFHSASASPAVKVSARPSGAFDRALDEDPAIELLRLAQRLPSEDRALLLDLARRLANRPRSPGSLSDLRDQ
jgi:transcriptional regulator with XRE-family HTH domain